MDNYRKLLYLKRQNEMNNENGNFTENQINTNNMSDWGDEETTTAAAGHSFQNGNGKKAANDDAWGDNNNDGAWGGGGATSSNNYNNDDNNDGGYRREGGLGRGGGARGGRGRGGGGGRGGGRRDFGDRDNANGNGDGENGGGYRRREGGGGRGGGRRDFGDRNGEDGGYKRREGGGGRRGDDEGGFGGGRNDKRRESKDGEEGEEGGEPQKPREFYIPPEPTECEEEMFGSGITSGINFSKYDNIPVKITGRNPPKSINTFEEANLRDLVMENIKKSGYQKATPIQKASIPVVMAGRDLMACAQTGSGKTAAYLLPIIHSLLNESADMSIGKPQALIVAPTRELAIQISLEARKFAHGSYLKVAVVYGGTSSKYQSENVSKGCHILIATPGRLLDFVDRTFITFEEIRFVVLDEADRMLDMGFKESMDRIMSHATMRDQRQSLMFSATFPEDIQQLASNYLKDYIFAAIGIVGGACSDVEQVIMEVPKFKKRDKLMELLQESADGTIVFVETKRSADFLASLLSETEYPTTSIHGDRLQRQREEALRDLKSGKMKVLVATSVAARGLDIRNVKHVVNYDMPDSLDEYVHRIGRTGRVGNNGRSTSFFDPEKDTALASGLIKILEGSKQEVPSFLHNYSTGGGGDYKSSKFGGRDVRQNKGGFSEQPQPQEAEEDWN